MKVKLLLIDAALISLLVGVLITLGGSLSTGAIFLLLGAVALLGSYVSQIVQFIKQSRLLTHQTLALSVALLVPATIFLHAFSASIDMQMVYRVQGFTMLYFLTGFLLPILFLYFSLSGASEEDKRWLRLGVSFGAIMCFSGFLGLARVLPVPGQFIIYSWVSLLFFYLIFLIKRYLSGKEAEEKQESLKLLVVSVLFLGFWVFRFVLSLPVENGLMKAIVHFGFIPIVLLPLAILFVRKLYAYVVFLLFFVCLDFYFIQYDANFNYLVDVGLHECVGYDDATEYELNTNPGISLNELMKEPTQAELDDILADWKAKDFSPKQIEIVHEEILFNGDSLKVISHLVNGQKHYGAIRIPKDLDVVQAPILLELEGGGTGLDISKLRPLTQARCSAQKDQFLSILPAYRGCIIRGNDFCFRSEGYCGDPWVGPAEDAVALLEAVKYLYRKPADTRVLASGLSRGATVALIIGGLTDKVDYIIATSTHTKFLDEHVLNNERVGQSYARAFYTPEASPDQIRKRLIASSPYFFAAHLPPFDLHQGTADDRTSVWHAQVLEDRLQELNRDQGTYNIFIHEGQGHAYDDEQAVCESIAAFLEMEDRR